MISLSDIKKWSITKLKAEAKKLYDLIYIAGIDSPRDIMAYSLICEELQDRGIELLLA